MARMIGSNSEWWSVAEVGSWLDKQGFPQYKGTFAHHRIDGEALLLLTEKDLKEDLKINILGDVKKLHVAILRLQNESIQAAPPVTPRNMVHGLLVNSSSSANHQQNFHPPTVHPSNANSIHPRTRTYSTDSQASDHPEQTKLASFRRPSGVATQLKPEYFKTLVSCLYMFLVTWITAIVMVFVHDRVPDRKRHPPLPDIFLDNVPHISWAFQLCEITILLLTTTWVCILFFHKHRSIAMRRFFALSGSVFLLRCATMFITSLSVPGSHLECAPRVGVLSKEILLDSLCTKFQNYKLYLLQHYAVA
ncbi:Sphingomyelin synthase-related protein 1 [Halocaridina rubra]|uniref:Sphingomyelin synthase-related protein 1 n=1 Tax=Halocaridina rubra TaxID=373956 RepID=A0AAN8WJB8_HALRR